MPRCRSGLRGFFQGDLQGLGLQQLICQQRFEFGVLLLQSPQSLGLLEVHAAVFALPAVEGLGADAVLPADFLGLELRSLRCAENADDLFGRVTGLLHGWFLWFSRKTISFAMGQFTGAQSPGSIGIIRTGDDTMYGNLILESA